MKKVISVLLFLAMVIGCFAGCTPEAKEDTALNAAAEYLYALYKEAKTTTDADYTVVGQVRINDVVYPIEWTTDKPENVTVVAGENGMTTIKITASTEDINYKLTGTLKNADGLTVSVSFDKIIPAKAVVAGKTIVLAFPKDNQFVSVTPDVYTSSSGSTKNQMKMTANEAEAVSLQIVENSDNTISFVSGEYYLYADGTHATFVKEQSDNTKFVLEAADTDGGYYVKCAYATYSGKPQYLEVYQGNLCSYGMGSDPSIYVFKLQESTVATGTPNMEGGNTGDSGNNSGSTDSGNNNTGDSGNNSGNNNTAGKPTTPAEIVDAAYALETGAALEGEYTLTGVITSIDTEWSEQYSNITVTIKVSGRESKPIQCFRMKGDGAQNLKVGDTITCTGKLINYNGKIEFDAGCKVTNIVAGSGSSSSGSSNSGSSSSGSSSSGSSNSGNSNVTTGASVTFDFSTLDKKGSEITAEDALALFNSVASGSGLVSVNPTKVYDGNGTGGAFENTAGLLKLGTSKVDGSLEMTFGKKVAKVEILCHDWYTKSDNYPTNSNTISVNGSTAQLAPYTETATAGTLTFNLDGSSETVSIVLDNTGSGYGRAFIFKIIVTFVG